ncbi:hypothetical protein CLG96_14575 [Sphingomonas oleivorans]|uniref:EF-hand domain-containing protein n=1 Tax=Sphingomonas oleivorans TaxID=1735121 RepID=A0A2T5FVH0_9SPHN|nr:hypothetical protein CLG96_14575 [Sphingomonas oleivorans]
MTAPLAAIAAALLCAPAYAQAGRDPAALLEQADADGNGKVSRAEFIAARNAEFGRLDRNGDGTVSDGDFPALARFRPEAAKKMMARLSVADTNGDGKTTRAEFAAAPAPIFDRADGDRDGFVTRAEINALKASLSAVN